MTTVMGEMTTNCYGLNVSVPLPSYVDALIPIVMVFGDRAFRGAIR